MKSSNLVNSKWRHGISELTTLKPSDLSETVGCYRTRLSSGRHIVEDAMLGLVDLPDVSGFQVLKGPQGSLYGQNATGGAIIIDSIAPSFDFKGRLSSSYVNYDV